MGILTSELRSQPIFASLDDSELEEICCAGTVQEYHKGEFLIREGLMNHFLFFITNGSVHVKSYGVKIARLTSGSVIGEVSAAGVGSPIADVTAADQVTAFKVPVSAIHKIASRNRKFESHLYEKAMARVLR